MSAVTSHVESRAPSDRTELVCPADFGAHPADQLCMPEPASAHARLLTFAWNRRIAEELLAGHTFHLEKRPKGRAGENPDALYIVLDQPIPRDAIPWSHMGERDLAAVPIFGAPGKMRCPTFDLPTGYLLLGGTCPAAGVCQTVTPIEERARLEAYARERGIFLGTSGPSESPGVSLPETICTSCYAQGGNYIYSNAQFRLALRYLWTRHLIHETGRVNDWVDTMVEAIASEDFLAESAEDPRTGQPVVPIRIHSSGDFFSPKYAEAWALVANQYPQILFWAPTRTWAGEGWLYHWTRILQANVHGNLVVRPSALHFGDFAPTVDAHPWEGGYPFNAAGTTSLRREGLGQDMAPLDAMGANFGNFDPRYDWGCQAYSGAGEARSCPQARNLDGQIGCRVCWTHPRVRVNFSAH
jgi:hypothetical protein